MPRPFANLTGSRFGRLLVTGSIRRGKQRWHICRCDCGNTTESLTSTLQTAKKKSCGCLRVDDVKLRSTTHGASANYRSAMPAEYKVWMAMRARCANEKLHRYGGRGIRICKRWDDFLNFIHDMGPRPSTTLTIERRKNDRGYSKSNCYWGTKKQQARNRHNNILVRYQGRRMSLAEACELSGVNDDAAKYRVKAGHPFNEPRRRTASDWPAHG